MIGFTPSLQISEKQNSFFVWSKYKTATYISVSVESYLLCSFINDFSLSTSFALNL